MKCQTHKCRGACCHNIVLPVGFIESHADKVVTAPISRGLVPTNPEFGPSEMVFTDPLLRNNKCPFLTRNYKCNVYADRPKICRMFGETDHPLLKCQYIK